MTTGGPNPIEPEEALELAYRYAEALLWADLIAADFWKAVPPARADRFLCADGGVDLMALAQGVRLAADRWKAELDLVSETEGNDHVDQDQRIREHVPGKAAGDRPQGRRGAQAGAALILEDRRPGVLRRPQGWSGQATCRTLIAFLVGLALGAIASAARAETVPAGWVDRPSPEAVAAFYPPQAARSQRQGRVDVACAVLAAGPPSACKVLKEEPAGHGFGEAALRMAPSLNFTPRMVDGAPSPAIVTFQVEFRRPAFLKALKTELGLK